MSNIHFFDDSGKVPKPKGEIRIETLEAEAYPDRRRVYVRVTVTPFQERPNLLLVLRDAEGNVVKELSVISTMHADMEFTIHLTGKEDTAGEYTLHAELFYETRKPPQDEKSTPLIIPEA